MKRLAAAAAALAALAAGSAAAKEKITYGYLIEPAMEGVLHGIKSGRVASDLIEIEATALAIPALIQSTPTKRFDVLMNAVMAIPRAKARGLALIVLSTALRAPPDPLSGAVWVKADSPYRTVADLKGKTIGNVALQSTGTTWARIALARKYGIDVSYKGGDFRWVQMPAPAMLGALEAGRVDAATLIHSQAYKAGKSGGYRVVAYTSRDINEIFGVHVVPAVNVSYPSKLAARPEAFKEFNRMLKASVDYAMANPEAVGAEIAKEHNISPEFFKAWLTRFSYLPATVSDADMKAMETVWAGAKELGILKEYPKAETVIWEHAIRE